MKLFTHFSPACAVAVDLLALALPWLFPVLARITLRLFRRGERFFKSSFRPAKKVPSTQFPTPGLRVPQTL
jgi:hypothetical protein